MKSLTVKVVLKSLTVKIVFDCKSCVEVLDCNSHGDNLKISYIEVKSEVITMSERAERSVKIPVFAGTSDSWTTWEPIFIATADLKGYGKLLTGDKVLTTDSFQIIEFKKKNREAYNGLLLANEKRECMSLIKTAKTVEYPRGDARKAFLALENKFKPKDKHTKIELKRLFQDEKLEDTKDEPETWITELTNLQLILEEVKVKMSDKYFWLHVLSNLPEVYETMVELLMRDLEEDMLNSDDTMSILREKFKRISKGPDTSDRALMDQDSKLECPHCGKSGHRAENCRSKHVNWSKIEE